MPRMATLRARMTTTLHGVLGFELRMILSYPRIQNALLRSSIWRKNFLREDCGMNPLDDLHGDRSFSSNGIRRTTAPETRSGDLAADLREEFAVEPVSRLNLRESALELPSFSLPERHV